MPEGPQSPAGLAIGAQSALLLLVVISFIDLPNNYLQFLFLRELPKLIANMRKDIVVLQNCDFENHGLRYTKYLLKHK
jgi:hypothetical protein